MSDEERARALSFNLVYEAASGECDESTSVILAALTAVRAEEREACAKIAEEYMDWWGVNPAEYIANDIRARKP